MLECLHFPGKSGFRAMNEPLTIATGQVPFHQYITVLTVGSVRLFCPFKKELTPKISQFGYCCNY